MTRRIYGDPQNPVFLIARATQLWRLGFADLASGDAYKAMLLLSQHLSAVFGGLQSHYEDLSGLPLDCQTAVRDASEIHKTLCLRRAAILHDLENLATAQAVIKEARVYYPSDPTLAQTEKHLAAELENLEEPNQLGQATINLNLYSIDPNFGGVYHLAYPFVPKDFLRRSEELILATKKEIENEAKKLFSSCSLGSSPVQDSTYSTNRGAPTALGIFATRDIPKGQSFLLDTTVLAATESNRHNLNAPEICDNCCGIIPTTGTLKRTAGCCSVLYCSQKCKDLAWKNYHQVLCKQDFGWVWDDSKNSNPIFNLDGPMWLRILAVCVQSKRHPLEHPLIARLTPLYDEGLTRRWSLANNIIMPNKILKQLGVDTYADPRFDTWVLQTLWARIVTNAVGCGVLGVSEIQLFDA